MVEIRPLPRTSPFRAGRGSAGGVAVPVVDLRLRFRLRPAERTVKFRIIIVDIHADGLAVSLGAVDHSVKEVMELHSADIGPVPAMGEAVETSFLRAMGRNNSKFILLLDVDKVLQSDDVFSIGNVNHVLRLGNEIQTRA